MSKSRSSERVAWENMISRCNNPKNKKYSLYGGRGIKVCEKWLKFSGFIEDMGLKPSNKHTLDRFPDNNKGYELENCRWALPSEQNRNHRRNIWIEYNNRKMVRKDWATEAGTTDINFIKWMRKGKTFEETYKHFKEIKQQVNKQ